MGEMLRLDKRVEVGGGGGSVQHKVNPLRRTQRGRRGGIYGKTGGGERQTSPGRGNQPAVSTAQVLEKTRRPGREARVDVFLGEGGPGRMGDRLVSGSGSGPPARGGTCRSQRSALQGRAKAKVPPSASWSPPASSGRRLLWPLIIFLGEKGSREALWHSEINPLNQPARRRFWD